MTTQIRTISIASGKGGVGKTSVAACVAWNLAERGHRVCLVDVDLGLSNVDVLMGLTPRFTLEDVVLGDAPVAQAMVTVRPGLDVLSGGAGVAALADLSRKQRAAFLTQLAALDQYEFLILDNSPGIQRQVVAFCLAAREQIIVVNPEPASVMDGYALFKVLRQNGLSRPPYILLNRVPQGFDHGLLMQRFAAVCKKHLQAAILPLGAIPDDPLFREAAGQCVLPVALHPQAPGAVALFRTASLLARRTEVRALYADPKDFWQASLANLLNDLPSSPRNPPSTSAENQTHSALDLIRRLERTVAAMETMDPASWATEQAGVTRLIKAGKRLENLAGRLASKM